jgi:hypothetical protein
LEQKELVSKLNAEAKAVENAQMNIPEEGVSGNTSGRLSMEELRVVFEDKLIESYCEYGLLAAHNEKG